MTTSKRVSKVTNKKRVATPVQIKYQSDIDPAQVVWSNRTHRTASEAFRDADYATPIWRCETQWDKTKEYLTWLGLWAFFLGSLYLTSTWFEWAMR